MIMMVNKKLARKKLQSTFTIFLHILKAKILYVAAITLILVLT
jgi:hypothetical protein